MIDLNAYEIIDLTHEMYNGMPGWITHTNFTVEQLMIMERDGYSVKRINMNTHHGTHLDAGAHMIKEGKSLDKYPLTAFLGEGTALNFSDKKDGEPITESDLRRYESYIISDAIILIYTGWYKFRGYSEKYLYVWPYLDESAATYLNKKRIKAVGTDGLSIGGWSSTTPMHRAVTDSAKSVHEILLKNSIIIEEMANIDKLLDGNDVANAFFSILPLNLKDSDGSPVRAIAFKEKIR